MPRPFRRHRLSICETFRSLCGITVPLNGAMTRSSWEWSGQKPPSMVAPLDASKSGQVYTTLEARALK
jgi:hypothetical protein